MKKLRYMIGALLCLGAMSSVAADESAGNPARAPALAILVEGSARELALENIGEFLFAAFSEQAHLTIVERSALDKILKEQELSLMGTAGQANAMTVGKLVHADFLLCVKPQPKDIGFRLLGVARGNVITEDTVARHNDLMLTAALIREKILLSAKVAPVIADKLTAGIATFVNRGVTDRGDSLSKELQKALRTRLNREPWATVLERQYPAELLGEVDLKRGGLTSGDTEKLPPADLVIMGELDDVSLKYVPGKPWLVTLDLTLLLRGQRKTSKLQFQSNDLTKAAEDVLKEINALRLAPSGQKPAEPEKDIWLRHIAYLNTFNRSDDYSRKMSSMRELVRAWENVLLLDEKDNAARSLLGERLFLLGLETLTPKDYFRLTPRENLRAYEQCLRGMRLLKEAAGSDTNSSIQARFHYCANRSGFLNLYTSNKKPQPLPKSQLRPPESKRILLVLDATEADPNPKPGVIIDCMKRMMPRYIGNGDADLARISKYLSAENPDLRFWAEYTTASVLARRKDGAALEHCDRAITLFEQSFAPCETGSHSNRWILKEGDKLYELRRGIGLDLGRSDEAWKSALAGARHFVAMSKQVPEIAGHHSGDIEVLRNGGDEKELLRIYDSYLAKNIDRRICAVREALEAKLSGTDLPNLASLPRIDAVLAHRYNWAAPRSWRTTRMAGARGTLFLVNNGLAKLQKPGEAIRVITNINDSVGLVVACGDQAYFAGMNGLYLVDSNGELLKHYSKKNEELPSEDLIDLQEGGGKVYMAYGNKYCCGLAALDPRDGSVTVLAPSGNKPAAGEPVKDVNRLRWDGVNSRLYAGGYVLTCSASATSDISSNLQPQAVKWARQADPQQNQVVTQGDEALQWRQTGRNIVFKFLKSGESVTCTLPSPWPIGDPTWDAKRIWLTTAAGVYQVNRADGTLSAVASDLENNCHAALSYGGQLYLIATDGVYSPGTPGNTPSGPRNPAL